MKLILNTVLGVIDFYVVSIKRSLFLISSFNVFNVFFNLVFPGFDNDISLSRLSVDFYVVQ